jgi:hypothetical protein
MLRQIALASGLVVCVAAVAPAITISAGDHVLLPNMPGQDIDMYLSGAGGADVYSDASMRTTIAVGGPFVTAVFNDTGGTIPAGNLAASIWAGGSGGIPGSPDGVNPPDTGQRTRASFVGAGGVTMNQGTNGIFATLTLSTVGVSPGSYTLSLTSHPIGSSVLFYWDEGLGDSGVVPGVVFENGTLTVVPEPASLVLGLVALGALAAAFESRKPRARPCA